MQVSKFRGKEISGDDLHEAAMGTFCGSRSRHVSICMHPMH